MVWQLAAMAAGGGLAAYGKMEENKQNQRLMDMKRRQLADQRGFLDKAQGLTTAQEKEQMSAAATSASMNSKNAAVQAFQGNSAQEAATGTSGTVGGTAFFNLGRAIVDARQNVNDLDSISKNQMEGMYLGFQQADLGYDQNRNGLMWEGKYLDLEQEKLDYANSPLSYGLAIGSGALGGLSMGASAVGAIDTLANFGKKEAAPASLLGGEGTYGATPQLGPPKQNTWGVGEYTASKPILGSGWEGTNGVFSMNAPGFQGMQGKSDLWQSPLLTEPMMGKKNNFSILLGGTL